jgi:hypothetical protein
VANTPTVQITLVYPEPVWDTMRVLKDATFMLPEHDIIDAVQLTPNEWHINQLCRKVNYERKSISTNAR